MQISKEEMRPAGHLENIGELVEWDRALLGIYTTRCMAAVNSEVERFLPPQRTTFYGFGRQALAEALGRAGVGPGDSVALPALICREVLASLAHVGATARFYHVNEDLQIDPASLDALSGRAVRAAIAVNYFGFPQPLDDLRAWCANEGATLIEDNAHGFLSVAGDVPLGQRGDFGVFSLRKTLTLPNGAALVDKRTQAPSLPANPLRFRGSSRGAEFRYRLKVTAKALMESSGPRAARTLMAVVRASRPMRMDVVGSSAGSAPETVMPIEALAPTTLRLLRRVDIKTESQRRSALFDRCASLLRGEPEIRPLFGRLPQGVVPQGFPFTYTGGDPDGFVRTWWRRGLHVARWPDLPAAVEQSAPEHYRRVMLVPFLW